MVDAQRNVIISLKLAGDPKNQTIAREIAGQAQFAADAATAVYRSNLNQFQKTEAGKTEIAQSESDKRIEQYAKDMEAFDKRRKAFNKRYEEAERLRTESSQKANEAAVVAVQGLADMAEGAAKLGLVSEDSFEKFARNFVMVQEGVRIFKGMTDVWWKGREALIALSTATNAQTTANNLLSVSNLRVAGTQAVGGAVAGRAGGGLAGQAVAGAAGGAAVQGGTALGGLAIVGKVAAVGAALVTVAAAAAEGIQGVRSALFGASEGSESIIGAMISQREAYDQATEAIERTTKAEKDRAETLKEKDAYRSITESRIDLQSQLRQSDNRVDEARAISGLDYRGNFVPGGEDQMQQADRLRREAARDVLAAEKELGDFKREEAHRAEQGLFRNRELTLSILQDNEEAYRNLYEADKNRLAVIRSQNQALKDQLKSEKEKLATLQESKRTEQQSLQSKLGQLNPGLRDRSIEVAEKIKSGEKLNRRDVMILQEAGVGQEHIDQYYASQGAGVQGADTFTEVFGSQKLKKNIQDSQQTVEQKTNQLAQGQQQERQAAQDLNSTADLLKQATEARVAQEAELQVYLKSQIKRMVENAKTIQEAGASASDAIHQQGMATVNAIRDMQNALTQQQEELRQQMQQTQIQKNGYQNP